MRGLRELRKNSGHVQWDLSAGNSWWI